MVGFLIMQKIAEVFELVSPPVYRLLLAEPAFERAKSATGTLAAVDRLAGTLPAADLVLAAVQHFASLSQNRELSDFLESLDQAINN